MITELYEHIRTKVFAETVLVTIRLQQITHNKATGVYGREGK